MAAAPLLQPALPVSAAAPLMPLLQPVSVAAPPLPPVSPISDLALLAPLLQPASVAAPLLWLSATRERDVSCTFRCSEFVGRSAARAAVGLLSTASHPRPST